MEKEGGQRIVQGDHFLRLILLLFFLARSGAADVPRETIFLRGLDQPVEIIHDRWGIPHIYAATEKDLFYAQGFNAACDRLFQLEMWRRRATGTLSEILGRRVLGHDIAARLFKPRNDLKRELNHYHPRGEEIIGSFVRGMNAFIDRTEANPELLPVEFRLLGIKPGRWTSEVVISRHNGLFRNARDEAAIARLGSIIGFEQLRNLLDLHPGEPELRAESDLRTNPIPSDLLELYEAYRAQPEFTPQDIMTPLRSALQPPFSSGPFFIAPDFPLAEVENWGSNNWVCSGKRTASGFPLLANDPHRQLQIPSLRYWVHLNGPGWNVIGGGEPALPGVSIGHNERGAWGLTIFAIDQEDVVVYDLNPESKNQYRYDGKWEEMTVIRESIFIKGEGPVEVELKFTRHGPVIKESLKQNKAYGLRAAWLEVGCAPYLASLRLDQAKTWEEFREACRYSLAPSENMIWADRDGNIGWQVVGIAPLRKGWNGLLPVPGDGRFEWLGYLPILELPSAWNPPEGYIATANQDNIPPDYPHSLGFMWAEPDRQARIVEVLSTEKTMDVRKMAALQQDVLSIPARQLVGLLKGVNSVDPKIKKALAALLDWDFQLQPDSTAAAIYACWRRHLSEEVWKRLLPEKVQRFFPYRSQKRMMDFLMNPGAKSGQEVERERNRMLLFALERALQELAAKFGPEMNDWKYGHEKFHHIKIRHPLSKALEKEWQGKYDLGPYPRGGDGTTVNNTSNSDHQTSGASFRMIVDLENWDNSIGTNTPGQSGNPESPHYADLFLSWARGEYFPVFFSRGKVESVAEKITLLKPLR